MDLKPKTSPGSPPILALSGNGNLANLSISELFSFFRSDVDTVEQVLVTRYAKLIAEIGPLQEKVELERLTRLQVQYELKKSEEQFQNGKRALQSYEKSLKEAKKRELRDKRTIEELRNRNRELERKWANDRNAVSELRNRVAELEDDVEKKNLEIIAMLRAENCKMVHLGNVNCSSVDASGEALEPGPLKEAPRSLMVYTRRRRNKGKVDLGI